MPQAPPRRPDRPRTRRATPRSVRRQERIANAFIALGGLGTVAAVLLIFGFLLYVVLPLFQSAELEPRENVPLPTAGTEEEPAIGFGVDDLGELTWRIHADGRLVVRLAVDGSVLRDERLFGDSQPTASVFTPDSTHAAFGFSDGRIVRATLGFETTVLEESSLDPAARPTHAGQAKPYEGGLLRLTPTGQIQYERLIVSLSEPLRAATSAIRLLDLSVLPNGAPVFGWLAEDGSCELARVARKYNIMEDRHVETLSRQRVEIRPTSDGSAPRWLFLGSMGGSLGLLFEDGRLERYDTRSPTQRSTSAEGPVEEAALLPVDRRVRIARHLLGKSTLLIGTDKGDVDAWFPTRPVDAYTRDGVVFARGHRLEGGASPVVAIASASRGRTVAVGYADGRIRLFQVTNERLLAEVSTADGEAAKALAFYPKDDGLVALKEHAIERWSLDLKHPEAGVAALFAKIWYEGAPAPAHEWQAEGGADDYEPKLGLMKLVVGTLKATLYSILFAAPLALLAALFTSEFLSPRWRAGIKSLIEMMAGLPSVVLGFLAAMVIAPYVRGVLPAVLCGLFVLPLGFVLGARIWQLLPDRVQLRGQNLPRLVAMTLVVPLAVLACAALGPALERACFGGDIEGWLRGLNPDVRGGWAFLLFPVSLVAVLVVLGRTLGPWIQRRTARLSGTACALVDLGRLLVVVGGGIALAYGLGHALWDTDPRGGVVGEYQLRNAMIVGFVMGFAIIPIIYTLAEDALTSVPRALREASLGCGATPWQTAIRIVVPTAMSGLFGALMVGLGRAVGETMIVLMAAGNTPILEWNVFSGFRTLSANIATELPEAVKNSTHYRVLFLAGFLLFVMTFVINTFAELVRRRFRRRFGDL